MAILWFVPTGSTATGSMLNTEPWGKIFPHWAWFQSSKIKTSPGKGVFPETHQIGQSVMNIWEGGILCCPQPIRPLRGCQVPVTTSQNCCLPRVRQFKPHKLTVFTEIRPFVLNNLSSDFCQPLVNFKTNFQNFLVFVLTLWKRADFRRSCQLLLEVLLPLLLFLI